MKRSLLLVCILVSLTTHAQIKRFSYKGGINYSAIPSVTSTEKVNSLPWYMGTSGSGYIASPVTSATLKERYESKPGFDLSASMDYSISPRFFITTGLTISYLRFKKSHRIEKLNGGLTDGDSQFPAGNPMGSIYGTIYFRDVEGRLVVNNIGQYTVNESLLQSTDDKGKTSTVYMQVPVLMGTTFFHDKLFLRAGFSFSYLLSASVYVDQYSYVNGIESHKEKSREGYTKLLASGTFMATYMVTKSIGIDLGANKFLSPIYDQSAQFKKAKFNTFSLGLNYTVNR